MYILKEQYPSKSDLDNSRKKVALYLAKIHNLYSQAQTAGHTTKQCAKQLAVLEDLLTIATDGGVVSVYSPQNIEYSRHTNPEASHNPEYVTSLRDTALGSIDTLIFDEDTQHIIGIFAVTNLDIDSIESLDLTFFSVPLTEPSTRLELVFPNYN